MSPSLIIVTFLIATFISGLAFFLYRRRRASGTFIDTNTQDANAENADKGANNLTNNTQTELNESGLSANCSLGTFFPDLPAVKDCLDFQSYAETLAKLIAADETKTPLTIGIFGAWGSGKTSLMRMIEELLREEKDHVLIRFDAWKYYKEDALWRAMLLRVLDSLRSRLSENEASLRLRIERLEQGLYRDVEWEEKGGLTIDWPKLITAGAGGALKLSFAFVPGLSALVKAVETAQSKIGEGKIAEDVSALAEAFKRDVVLHRQSQLRYIEQFQQEFANLVKERFQNKRLVIFVDDLDRCLPERAIEVLEAIKLFLDVEGCVFVLGVDLQVITRGIELKYKALASSGNDDLPTLSSHYIEKIIQLPFLLPPIEAVDMQSYVDSLNADWPASDCAQIFAEGLAPNPRQVKRTINVFMLLWQLALKRRAKLGEAVTPLRLAKVVVLQTSHPRVFEHLKSNPLLLRQLEILCRDGDGPGKGEIKSEPIDNILKEAAQQSSVRKLFQLFIDDESAQFAGLGLNELATFFSLARRAPLVSGNNLRDSSIMDFGSGTAIEQTAPERERALFQLRPPVRDFVGRAQEISTLTSALKGGGTIAAITGMAGTGKTELALMVADQLGTDYPDAQLFVDLRGTDAVPLEPAEALKACLRAFDGQGSNLPEDRDELIRLYRSRLNDKRVLVVLDNAADSTQVDPLLAPKGCALLVTSRTALSLPGMAHIKLEQLPADEATQLLLSIVPRIPNDIAQQICSLCGYLPPAIRAAGSTLAIMADLEPATFVAQLRDERTRLERIGAEGVDVRVEASFNLSYSRLQKETARNFRRLAVFPASFDASAEEVICEDEDHKHLSELVKRSLVLYDNAVGRYRLHDLMRLFADRRLNAEERYVLAGRHASYYLEITRNADILYQQGGEALKRGLDLFDLEWNNIQAGYAWATLNAEADEEAAKLCNAYAKEGALLFELRQPPRWRIERLSVALNAALRIKDRAAQGIHLMNLGLAHAKLGDTAQAIKYQEEALAITREVGLRRSEGLALANLGIAYRDLGDTNKAIKYFQQQLDIAREIADKRAEALALINLGNAYYSMRDGIQAIKYQEQALPLTREIGDRRIQAVVLGNLGIANMGLRKTSIAIEYLQQQLDIAREIGDKLGEANAIFNISLALDKLNERGKAIIRATEALEIYERLESPNAHKVRERLTQWQQS